MVAGFEAVLTQAGLPCRDPAGRRCFGEHSCGVAGSRFWAASGLELFKLQIFMNLKEVKLDHSISQLHYMLSCHLPAFIKRLYPKLYPIVNVTDPKSYCDGGDEVNMKPQNICTVKEKLQKNEAYIMDNGEYIFLYVGQEIPLEFCQQVIKLLDFGHFRRFSTQDIHRRHHP
jgi:hypothetical protein